MPDLRSYLDHNASAPLVEEARMAMVAAFDHVGNPSSVHSEGRASRALIEAARRDVAALVGAPAGNVVFTSGATEGAATLLTPRYREGRTPLAASHLYVGATEHPCVLAGGGFGPGTTTVVPVDAEGIVDRDALRRALAAHDTQEGVPLVAVQMANNETGVDPADRRDRGNRARGRWSVRRRRRSGGRANSGRYFRRVCGFPDSCPRTRWVARRAPARSSRARP